MLYLTLLWEKASLHSCAVVYGSANSVRDLSGRRPLFLSVWSVVCPCSAPRPCRLEHSTMAAGMRALRGLGVGGCRLCGRVPERGIAARVRLRPPSCRTDIP